MKRAKQLADLSSKEAELDSANERISELQLKYLTFQKDNCQSRPPKEQPRVQFASSLASSSTPSSANSNPPAATTSRSTTPSLGSKQNAIVVTVTPFYCRNSEPLNSSNLTQAVGRQSGDCSQNQVANHSEILIQESSNSANFTDNSEDSKETLLEGSDFSDTMVLILFSIYF